MYKYISSNKHPYTSVHCTPVCVQLISDVPYFPFLSGPDNRIFCGHLAGSTGSQPVPTLQLATLTKRREIIGWTS